MKKKQKEELENMEVSDMLKRIRGNLQQEVQMTTLIQNIFQVYGCVEDWQMYHIDQDALICVGYKEKNRFY